MAGNGVSVWAEGGFGNDTYVNVGMSNLYVTDIGGSSDLIQFTTADIEEIHFFWDAENLIFYNSSDIDDGGLDSATVVVNVYGAPENRVEFVADATGSIYSLDFLFV